ncbi:DNA mismatch repair protein [Gaertneriomyces sp. JEL0708]|nr:DNA mismatch repair protein [Gaertneriomyces sp. JEL0708]
MPIEKLPAETVQQLRSGVVINSFPQCVVELVQNALDAAAAAIEILVDLQSGSVQVTDDGSGITPSDLKLLGQRYATSKAGNQNTCTSFGFRGEALASISEIARIEIITRSTAGSQTFTVHLKDGKQLFFGLAPFGRRRGTTIIVRDIFHRYPVRQKSLLGKGTMIAIRRSLEPIALLAYKTSITLIDQNRDFKVFATRRSDSHQSMFRQLFGFGLAQDLVPVRKARRGYEIHGFISRTGFANRYHQYIFVNGHLMNACELHKIVYDSISKSSFGCAEEDEGVLSFNSLEMDFSSKGRLKKSKYSKRMRSDHPVFFLLLTCPADTYDILLDPMKNRVQFRNWSDVMHLLNTCVEEFLLQEGFMDAMSDTASLHGQASSHGSSSLEIADENVSASLPATYSKRAANLEDPFLAQDVRPTHEGLLGKADMDSVFLEFQSIAKADPTVAVVNVGERDGSNLPQSGDQGRASVQGENSCQNGCRQSKGRAEGGGGPSHVDRRGLRKSRWAHRTSEDGKASVGAIGTALRGLYMSDLLKKWNNPVFARGEKLLPMLFGQSDVTKHALSHFDREVDKTFAYIGAHTVEESISKKDLEHMRVLSQVDRKFIVCQVERNGTEASSADGTPERRKGGGLLVIVDQHAADERIKLEAMLSELYCGLDKWYKRGDTIESEMIGPEDGFVAEPECIVATVDFNPNLTTSLPMSEAQNAMSLLASFRRWGVYFSCPQGDDQTRMHSSSALVRPDMAVPVHIQKLPRLIADRCVADPGVIRDIIRQHVYGAVTESAPSGAPVTGGPPKGILEILKSKACRTAIMFGDMLSKEECEQLISNLKSCKFPFQCAHGRPSMVPLFDLHSVRNSRSYLSEADRSRMNWVKWSNR